MSGSESILVRQKGNALERVLDSNPVVGLTLALVYTVVLGWILVAVVRAFRRPNDPEELMTDIQRVRWQCYQRIEKDLDPYAPLRKKFLDSKPTREDS